jgi:HTH-type transcriptional regulator/antitoxin HigA
MIKTNRQYHATKSQLAFLTTALQAAQAIPTPDIFRTAHIQSLQSDIQTLQHELTLYDRQINGEFDLTPLQAIPTLGQTLIRARIACQLTQKDLAQALGKKEQAIQRLEATDYTTASLATLTTIAETLTNHQRTRPT